MVYLLTGSTDEQLSQNIFFVLHIYYSEEVTHKINIFKSKNGIAFESEEFSIGQEKILGKETKNRRESVETMKRREEKKIKKEEQAEMRKRKVR